MLLYNSESIFSSLLSPYKIKSWESLVNSFSNYGCYMNENWLFSVSGDYNHSLAQNLSRATILQKIWDVSYTRYYFCRKQFSSISKLLTSFVLLFLNPVCQLFKFSIVLKIYQNFHKKEISYSFQSVCSEFLLQ